MTSLYQLTAEYIALETKLNDSNFDLVTIADTLESATGDIETKAINVAMFIQNRKATITAMKEAEKNMADRRKSLEVQDENMIEYLMTSMVRCGISKIESPYLSLKLQQNPPSVVIDDEALIPADYFVQPETPPPALSKALIKQAIADGYVVPGARLEQKQRLVIR